MTDLFLFIHGVLLALWFFCAERERQTRADGPNIARYLVTDVGNTIGLTCLNLATAPTLLQLHWIVAVLCLVGGCLIAIRLDRWWRARSRYKTVGMYQDGQSTLAGKLHFVFMIYEGGLLLSLPFSGALLTSSGQIWFGLACTFYWGAFLVDHYFRKVL